MTFFRSKTQTRFFKNRLLLLAIIIDVLLIAAVFGLMHYVQYLLNEDVRINLTEIVTQNKDVISSRLTMELNNIELEAKQLSDRLKRAEAKEQEQQEDVFRAYVAENKIDSLVWAASSGQALSATDKKFDISGRQYFRIGVKGLSNISERLISRVSGEDVFIICVPVWSGTNVIGTLQKQYTPQEIYDLCEVSLFSEKGSTYIIDEDGYILICSENSKYNTEADNYYRIVYSSDKKAAEALQRDIKLNKPGFMEAVVDNQRVFSAYTSIESIPNWYLISSISTDAVSPNANVVVRLFYCVLLVMAVMFTFSIWFYMDLKRKQRLKLENVAFVDGVTDGDSYTKFTVELEKILQEHNGKEYYICAFDIDNFKYINSFYGFEAGDVILHKIYQYYQGKLNSNERIARTSGDRFVIFLENPSEERLKNLIIWEMTFEDITIYLSAGLYHITDSRERISLMVDKAFTAAQKTKGLHFKRFEMYSDTFDEEIARNEQLKRAVEAALQGGEIIPYFQPKVDIQTRELIGAEALARWKTKEGKLIPPGQFIPICEKSGLIVLVDMVIFEKTLQFIRSNLDKGIDCVPISVNFSRMHLLNDEFLKGILEKLEKYNVPAELVELELTETVIFDNYQTISTFIDELHSYGLKISMDDFGTGYSSLHMLKDIDIDVLKIDRGFLLDTERSNKQRIIFGTIVQMAKQLKIKVVVEGVETIENVQMMDEFDCPYAQGFYFARPMSREDFETVYKNKSV